MRIEALRALVVAVVLLIGPICLHLAAGNNLTLVPPVRNGSREYWSRGSVVSQWQIEDIETRRATAAFHKYRDIQNLLRREGGEEGAPVECCPTVEELSEPVGGKNRQERYVELYRNGDNRQYFYEYSCRPDVLDKPCRFIDRKLANQSRCVQRFSYTYALVSDPGSKAAHQHKAKSEQHRHRHGRDSDSLLPDLSTIATPGTNWSLDYIRVRSGCSCELLPKQKSKKNNATPHKPKTKQSNKSRKSKSHSD